MIKYLCLVCLIQVVYSEQYFYLSKKADNVIEQYLLTSNGNLQFLSQLKLPGGPGGLTLSSDSKHIYFSISNDETIELGTAVINQKGKLSFLGKSKIESGGSGTISKCGHFYLKYNYRANTVSVLEMEEHLHTGRQIQEIRTTKNPHDIGVSNDGSLVFIPHNGQNRLYQFSLNSDSGELEPLNPPYLEGAKFEEQGFSAFRSLAFHPQKNVVYCTYEKGGGLASLRYDENGLKLWQEFSTVDKGVHVLPTTVALSPNKQFLFVPNRGVRKSPTSITTFRLDPKSGRVLSRVGVFETSASGPRSITVDETGDFLFTSSVKTNKTYQFKINKDGSLKLFKEHKMGSGSMLIIGTKSK
ncbi:beta-propeller fold lactonase family protein [Lentisphaera marina]|uniref:lactonase family protein n=1 Tax=Lentisphaera marina TaxID=1111041 RepID=UPI0023664667|nr:beta-propeller fold lactonase family protein [Lentisphaera marina]MDD7984640.1 beta-propeller fold lactonase family protein [Lentisphaera marina]